MAGRQGGPTEGGGKPGFQGSARQAARRPHQYRNNRNCLLRKNTRPVQHKQDSQRVRSLQPSWRRARGERTVRACSQSAAQHAWATMHPQVPRFGGALPRVQRPRAGPRPAQGPAAAAGSQTPSQLAHPPEAPSPEPSSVLGWSLAPADSRGRGPGPGRHSGRQRPPCTGRSLQHRRLRRGELTAENCARRFGSAAKSTLGRPTPCSCMQTRRVSPLQYGWQAPPTCGTVWVCSFPRDESGGRNILKHLLCKAGQRKRRHATHMQGGSDRHTAVWQLHGEQTRLGPETTRVPQIMGQPLHMLESPGPPLSITWPGPAECSTWVAAIAAGRQVVHVERVAGVVGAVQNLLHRQVSGRQALDHRFARDCRQGGEGVAAQRCGWWSKKVAQLLGCLIVEWQQPSRSTAGVPRHDVQNGCNRTRAHALANVPTLRPSQLWLAKADLALAHATNRPGQACWTQFATRLGIIKSARQPDHKGLHQKRPAPPKRPRAPMDGGMLVLAAGRPHSVGHSRSEQG